MITDTNAKYRPKPGWHRPILRPNQVMPYGKHKGQQVALLCLDHAKYMMYMQDLDWHILDDECTKLCLSVLDEREAHPNHPMERPATRRFYSDPRNPNVQLSPDIGDFDAEQFEEDYDRFMAEYGYSRDWT